MTTEAPKVPASTTAPSPGNERLMSIDALRGFDMFWITHGRELFLAIVALIYGGAVPAGLERQFHHPDWNGFTFWDLIFPLFLFLVGVVMPFSLCRRVEQGESKGPIYWRICRRTVLLLLLSLICNGLLRGDFEHLRYGNILARIGLAYFFASIIMLNTSVRGQVAWIVVLLFGYWAALTLIPIPGFGAGNLEPGKTVTDYVDRLFLSGHLYHGDIRPIEGALETGPSLARDPEGLFGTISSIATVLLGALAGQWLRQSRRNGHAKAAGLAIAGVACLVVGYTWGLVFPINKNLWTSSYVLWAGGWSLLLLSLFYWVIDVCGWKKWAFFFVVIGANAITIYVGQYFIDFNSLSNMIFGNAPIHPKVLAPLAYVAVQWLLLYGLYRNRIFLRL